MLQNDKFHFSTHQLDKKEPEKVPSRDFKQRSIITEAQTDSWSSVARCGMESY